MTLFDSYRVATSVFQEGLRLSGVRLTRDDLLVGDVIRVAIDAETVAQAWIHRADCADHGTPEWRRDQAEGPQPALLDEVDEHVSLANPETGA